MGFRQSHLKCCQNRLAGCHRLFFSASSPTAAEKGAHFSENAAILDVVKLPLNLWGFKDQWPTPHEVKHPTFGTIQLKKCRNDITAVIGGVGFSVPFDLSNLHFPCFSSWQALRVYSHPGQGVQGAVGGRAISYIRPLSPKQRVSLSGLVS